MMRLAVALLLPPLIIPDALHAQGRRDSVDSKALRDPYVEERGYLRREGIDLNEKAESDLRARGESVYRHQRVEVTGIWSSDDTSEEFNGWFDGPQIKPSYLSEDSGRIYEEDAGWLPERVNRRWHKARRWWQRRNAQAKDVDTLLGVDKKGMLSERGKEVLSQLRGMSINEIVAHSWGSELIYNAILQGYIDSPKRIIVVGPPTANANKWKILKEYTGIEVYVYGSEGDKARWAAVNAEMLPKLELSMPYHEASLRRIWDEACRMPGRNCGSGRDADAPHIDLKVKLSKPGSLNHGRDGYYRHLIEEKVLASKAAAMRLEQDKKVLAEENRILSETRTRLQIIRAGSQRMRDRMAAERRERETRKSEGHRYTTRALPPYGSKKNEPMSELTARALPVPGQNRSRMTTRALPAPACYFGKSFEVLARTACAAPGAVKQEHLDSWDWFPTNSRPDYSCGKHLSGCERELFNELIRLNETGRRAQGKLSAGWVDDRARVIRARYPNRRIPQPTQQQTSPTSPEPTPPNVPDCIKNGGHCWSQAPSISLP